MHRGTGRWILILVLLVSACPAFAAPGTWDHYRNRFITQDGRIVDFYQNSISHSEGQGYGLLLSVLNNDPATFDHILSWTRDNLMVRKDFLSAWSWGQQLSGAWNVIDYNNATDGDLLIAWSLVKAGKRWNRPELTDLGMKIAGIIHSRLVIQWRRRMVLLPGYYGFTRKEGITVNPSYFVFPAFDQLAKDDASGFWKNLSTECITLTERASQGRLKLPADWIMLDADGKTAIDSQKSRYFGYDAIRIPLYLAMSGNTKQLETYAGYLSLFHRLGYLPRRVDLIDEMISLEDAPAGFYAVFSKCAQLSGDLKTAQQLMQTAASKIQGEPDDYYSNTLFLLALTVGTP